MTRRVNIVSDRLCMRCLLGIPREDLVSSPTAETAEAGPIPNSNPTPVPDEHSLALAQACAALALSKKADEVALLHVEGVTSFTDFFLVASAPSERQVAAIATAIEDGLRDCGIRPMGVEGKEAGAWVLVDLGEVVVHLYLDTARTYYDIEGFWADAPRIAADEARGLEVLKEWEETHRETVKARREAL